MATDYITMTRGRVKVAYLCETGELKVIRIDDGEVLFNKTVPDMTVGEYCAAVDKYDKLCNYK